MNFQENNSYQNYCDERFFIPNNSKKLQKDDVFRYLQNLELEIEQGLFTENEILLLLQDALYGRFLYNSRRPFFLYHFLPLWMNSVQTLFRDCPNPKIIELGCGTGTSSLLFAILGARVIGVELNVDLVEICNKRKRFYERYVGDLKAEFYQANTFDFPFEEHAPVDSFFSLFAFNLMKPADLLLARMMPALKKGGHIMIIDGNVNNIYSHIIPSRRRPGVLSPPMMKRELERLGCRVVKLETHCGIPPLIFRSAITRDMAFKMEDFIRVIGLHRFFGVSYTIVAEKISGEQ
ncbi:MAG: class I SAM-dependent methyltransferase [Armatimonadetes bacterium]|nr:class I SAM-dependent methyltransferase [Armatimonadota bacterium]